MVNSKAASVVVSRVLLLFTSLGALTSCQGHTADTKETNITGGKSVPFSIYLGNTVTDLGKNIDCIFQDSKGNYWFASNGEGVYRYDGNTMLHITPKNGVLCDFVWTISEDPNGKLWFVSNGDAIFRFNGQRFLKINFNSNHERRN